MDRVRIADTVGISTPIGIFNLIKSLSESSLDMDIEFHGHNDLGMASANAISAVEAGAKSLSVTVNGLGERSGNTPLEQVATALMLTKGFRSRIKTENLMGLCYYIATVSGRPIPLDRPVTGSIVFTHESGIHCAGLLKDLLSYQPYLPETVGRKGSQFVLGSHSGSRSIRHTLGMAGINISRAEAFRLKEVLSHVAV